MRLQSLQGYEYYFYIWLLKRQLLRFFQNHGFWIFTVFYFFSWLPLKLYSFLMFNLVLIILYFMFLTTKKLEKSKVHLVASRNYHWNAEGARKCFQKRFPLFIDILVVTKFFSVNYFVLLFCIVFISMATWYGRPFIFQL